MRGKFGVDFERNSRTVLKRIDVNFFWPKDP